MKLSLFPPRKNLTIFAVFSSELERGEAGRKMSPVFFKMSLDERLIYQVCLRQGDWKLQR